MHEQQASGKTNVNRSLCGEMEAWLLRRHEGTTRSGGVLHSEERFWAEGRPVLCLWYQGDSHLSQGPTGLPPGAIPGTRRNNPMEKLAVR